MPTCQTENTGDSIFLNFEKPYIRTPISTAGITVSYLNLGQQAIIGESDENIRETNNFDLELWHLQYGSLWGNLGDLTGMLYLSILELNVIIK